MPRFILPHALISLVMLCALSACAPSPDAPTQDLAPAAQTHRHTDPLRVVDSGRFLGTDARSAVISSARPFKRVGVLMDAWEPEALRVRAQRASGTWGPWRGVTRTWSEEDKHVGHVLLLEPAIALEFEVSATSDEVMVEQVEHLYVEFFDDWLTPQPEEPAAPSTTITTTRTQALAPAGLVIPRDEWGARAHRGCSRGYNELYRVSIHHTFLPADDGPDPAARVRQMQNYHMDSNGWCDIGYHFIISQSGKIYQGRDDERRTGAHVGGQNTGNVGISFIGDYTSDQPPQAQVDAAVRLLSWIKQTYNIPWTRDNVKGHRQWPGQSTSCPGDNLLDKIDGMMAQVDDPVPQTYEVSLDVAVSGGQVLVDQGASAGIPDALEGEDLQTIITLTNASDQVLRGVRMGFSFDDPSLRAVDYRIETDFPAKDLTTWMLNDANDSPENPPKDTMGQQGTLDMNAFGPGESKRVVVELEASQYSEGAPARVRGWVQNIDDVYSDHVAFDDTPTLNKTGMTLSSSSPVDVFATDHWSWNVPTQGHSEGWEGCYADSNVSAEPAENQTSLQVRVTNNPDGACALSPAWTSIDAASWPQMVLRTTRDQDAAFYVISWENEAGTHHANIAAPAAPGVLVLAMSTRPQWSGAITRVAINALPKDAVSHFYMDALFFQDPATGQTNSANDPFVDQLAQTWVPDDALNEVPVTPIDPVTPTPTPGATPPNTRIATNGGCECSSTQGPDSGSLSLALFGLLGLGLRRRRRAP